MPIKLDGMTLEELQTLRDMMGDKSPSLRDALQNSRGKSLEQTFKDLKTPSASELVDQWKVPGPQKAASESADVFRQLNPDGKIPEAITADKGLEAYKQIQPYEKPGLPAVVPKNAPPVEVLPPEAPVGKAPPNWDYYKQIVPTEKPGMSRAMVPIDPAGPGVMVDGPGKAASVGMGAAGAASQMGSKLIPGLGAAAAMAYSPDVEAPEATKEDFERLVSSGDNKKQPPDPEDKTPNSFTSSLPMRLAALLMPLSTSIREDETPWHKIPNPAIADHLTPLQDEKEKKVATAPTSPVASSISPTSTESDDQPSEPTSSPMDLINKLLGDDRNQMIAAQDATNNNQLWSHLGRAGNSLGSAIARQGKADNSFYDVLDKTSDKPVRDLAGQKELEKDGMQRQDLYRKLIDQMMMSDPNSTVSKNYQLVSQQLAKDAKMAGMNFSDIPASILEKLQNVLLKRSDTLSQGELKKISAQWMNAYRMDSLNNRKEMGAARLNEKATNPYVLQLDNSDKLQGMLTELQRPENANNPRIRSWDNVSHAIQNDIAKLLQGSNSTAVYDRSGAEISALTKSLTKMAQFVISKPLDLVPDAYLSQLQLELNNLRSKIFTGYYRKSKQLSESSTDPVVKGVYERTYKSQADLRGVDPDTQKPIVGEYGDKEPAIEAFMKANNLNREQAIKFLKTPDANFPNGRL